MASRDYAVDVAVYQSASMSAYKNAGARQVIVKLTEGTGYFNPKATAQIKSTHANHMYLHAYHFATFSDSVSRAKAEAKFFVAEAKRHNISKKRYLWLDWETGDGNSVVGSKTANTRAILAFMNICHNAGYRVGLYSGASLLKITYILQRLSRSMAHAYGLRLMQQWVELTILTLITSHQWMV